ncbi:MAG: TIGR02466 family protein [Steroidobacteraceae bacterium]
MAIKTLFPTLIYTAPLQKAGVADLNRRLERECVQLAVDDEAGVKWSAKNYPGGFTSYGSQSRMHTVSPTFAALEARLNRHVRAYAAQLDFDLTGRELSMTDCWVNIMPQGVVHSLHLHPLSTISGTYYVRTPKGSAGLRLEDPRLDRFMGAPPRKATARDRNRSWVTLPAERGQVVLFESWLRHEVPPNPAASERISISFNYSWF